MAAEADARAIAASLLELVEHGESLGLHESECPLCTSKVTLSEFESRIECRQEESGGAIGRRGCGYA